MSGYAMEARNLGRRFGSRVALHGLSLGVQPGEIVGLFGANGAGKTTTLRLLSGLLEPSTGEVQVFGHPVPAMMNKVGVVLEQPAFYPRLTARENLAFALTFAGRDQTEVNQNQLLNQVGLGTASGPVARFSLGMRRRLALAIALSKDPTVLLLDEPTNGLDIDGVRSLRQLLRERAERGTACLLSTHEWDEAERLVDRVVVLDRGRVVRDATLSSLVSAAGHWTVRSAAPQVRAILQALVGVTVLASTQHGEHVIALKEIPITAVTEQLVVAGCTPESVTPYRRSLADVYHSIAGGRTDA